MSAACGAETRARQIAPRKMSSCRIGTDPAPGEGDEGAHERRPEDEKCAISGFQPGRHGRPLRDPAGQAPARQPPPDFAEGVRAGQRFLRGNIGTPIPTPLSTPRRPGQALNEETAGVLHKSEPAD